MINATSIHHDKLKFVSRDLINFGFIDQFNKSVTGKIAQDSKIHNDVFLKRHLKLAIKYINLQTS